MKYDDVDIRKVEIDILEKYKNIFEKHINGKLNEKELSEIRHSIRELKNIFIKYTGKEPTIKKKNGIINAIDYYVTEPLYCFDGTVLDHFLIGDIKRFVGIIDILIGEIKNGKTPYHIAFEKEQKTEKAKSNKDKSIFLVHGRDNNMKNNVRNFLREIGCDPIILHEQVDGGNTIIEKFEKHSNTSFAVILFSPDDEGRLSLGKNKTNNRILLKRARQNVVFEFGFFVGKLGRGRVRVLQKKDVEKPSDIDGVLYIPYIKNWRDSLKKELINAGFDLK